MNQKYTFLKIIARNKLSDFVTVSYNSFEKTGALYRDESYADSNVFNEVNFKNFDAQYFFENEVGNVLKDSTQHKHLSIMHLNLRCLNANFNNFVELFGNISESFHTICLVETWVSNNDFKNNSQYNLPNYISFPFERRGGKKVGSIVICIKIDLEYKTRNILSISNCIVNSLRIEINIENASNFMISYCYRP